MPVRNLSEVGPQQLVCPPHLRRIEVVDVGGLGLYCEVRASSPGVGTYYLRYKDTNGKTCHQKIGSTAVITVADARKEAKRLKAGITLGADPRAEAKARKAVMTYAEFFEQHYLPYIKLHKRSWKRDEELYRLRIKAVFGGKRLNQMTRYQVQLFQKALADEGLAPATVNHHQKVLRASWNVARNLQMVDGDNPSSGVPMLFEDNKIERLLSDEELERLMTVLRSAKNRAICNIALLLLGSGLRCGEALRLRHDDIDEERRLLTIRATNSKSKRVRSVPINDVALAALYADDTRGEFEHVFINRRTKLPYTTIARSWDKLRKMAGLPRLRIHDLRHGHASLLLAGGRTLFEVQTILGHSDPKVTMRYAHLSGKTLSEASAVVSAKLTGTMSKSASQILSSK